MTQLPQWERVLFIKGPTPGPLWKGSQDGRRCHVSICQCVGILTVFLECRAQMPRHWKSGSRMPRGSSILRARVAVDNRPQPKRCARLEMALAVTRNFEIALVREILQIFPKSRLNNFCLAETRNMGIKLKKKTNRRD